MHNLTKVYCIQNQIHAADCSIKNVAAIGEEGWGERDNWQDEVNKHIGDGRTLLAEGSAARF